MLRKILVVLVAGLALAACENPPGDEDPDVAAEQDADAEPDEEVGEDVTPEADLDDCAEVSAAEGAPAGMTMMDSFFEPPCIAVSSTQQISLTNSGNILHNFSVANGDIDVDVEPGEEALTDEVGTDLAAGTYRFFCEYHESEGMVGTLVVE